MQTQPDFSIDFNRIIPIRPYQKEELGEFEQADHRMEIRKAVTKMLTLGGFELEEGTRPNANNAEVLQRLSVYQGQSLLIPFNPQVIGENKVDGVDTLMMIERQMGDMLPVIKHCPVIMPASQNSFGANLKVRELTQSSQRRVRLIGRAEELSKDYVASEVIKNIREHIETIRNALK